MAVKLYIGVSHPYHKHGVENSLWCCSEERLPVMIVTVTLAEFGGGRVCFDLRSKIRLVCFSSLTALVKGKQAVF